MSLLLEGADSESLKKELQNKQYSVIEIKEAPTNTEPFFSFVIRELGGETRPGKMQSQDILSAYTKLVDDLGYDIQSIAPTDETQQEKIQTTTQKVKKLYELSRKKNPVKKSIIQKQKDVLSKKKVDNVQKVLLLGERLYEEVLEELTTQGKQTKEMLSFGSEIKILKNISNINKIHEFMRILLNELAGHIIELLPPNNQAKGWIGRINKLSKKVGNNKKYSLDKKKSLSDAKFVQKVQSGATVVFAHTEKKKNLYDALRLQRAKKQYTNETRQVVKGIFSNGLHDTYIHLRAIGDRMSEIDPKGMHVGMLYGVCRAIIISLMVGLVVLSLFVVSGFVYEGLRYTSLSVVSLLSLFLFLFLVKASRVWLVVCFLVSILLGTMIPNF